MQRDTESTGRRLGSIALMLIGSFSWWIALRLLLMMATLGADLAPTIGLGVFGLLLMGAGVKLAARDRLLRLGAVTVLVTAYGLWVAGTHPMGQVLHAATVEWSIALAGGLVAGVALTLIGYLRRQHRPGPAS